MCRRVLENTKGRDPGDRKARVPVVGEKNGKNGIFRHQSKQGDKERDRWPAKLQVERCRLKLAHTPSSASVWEMLSKRNDMRGGASLTSNAGVVAEG